MNTMILVALISLSGVLCIVGLHLSATVGITFDFQPPCMHIQGISMGSPSNDVLDIDLTITVQDNEKVRLYR